MSLPFGRKPGDCILCSELCNKTFCDCVNWKGTCIYQEFIWNGGKAKEERKTYLCEIVDKKNIEDDLIILTLKLPYDLYQSLVHPGSYVFLRNPEYKEYFDVPISVLDLNPHNSTIDFAIEVQGVKTKKINNLSINDNISVKGPYWNGDFGLKHILNAKGGNSIIIARSIGLAPMLPVLKSYVQMKIK
jgi:2-polyprenylphenol hydroxylase and related flavodoxin oxidoreductases